MKFEWSFKSYKLGSSRISLSRKSITFNEAAMWWVPCFHYSAPTKYIYIGFPVWWKCSLAIFKHNSTHGWNVRLHSRTGKKALWGTHNVRLHGSQNNAN